MLRDGDVVLRPLTKADWPVLMHFNDDAEIGWFVEGDKWEPPVLEVQQRIYRSISERAHCFVIELDGRPVANAGCRG